MMRPLKSNKLMLRMLKMREQIRIRPLKGLFLWYNKCKRLLFTCESIGGFMMKDAIILFLKEHSEKPYNELDLFIDEI